MAAFGGWEGVGVGGRGSLIDETANRILHRPIASTPILAREYSAFARTTEVIILLCVFTGSDLVSRHEEALSFFERDRHYYACSRGYLFRCYS